MNSWNIWLNGKLFDVVFFVPECDADYVYRALVNHDGYDSRIIVKKGH